MDAFNVNGSGTEETDEKKHNSSRLYHSCNDSANSNDLDVLRRKTGIIALHGDCTLFYNPFRTQGQKPEVTLPCSHPCNVNPFTQIAAISRFSNTIIALSASFLKLMF